jgi:hypothetical protein
MATVLISIGIFFLIGLAIAVPVLLLARYTRADEQWGNRFFGLFVEGLRGDEGRDRAGH